MGHHDLSTKYKYVIISSKWKNTRQLKVDNHPFVSYMAPNHYQHKNKYIYFISEIRLPKFLLQTLLFSYLSMIGFFMYETYQDNGFCNSNWWHFLEDIGLGTGWQTCPIKTFFGLTYYLSHITVQYWPFFTF